jgi:hypothetical protein
MLNGLNPKKRLTGVIAPAKAGKSALTRKIEAVLLYAVG